MENRCADIIPVKIALTIALILMLLLVLTGCCDKTTITSTSILPVLKEYSLETQQQIKKEVQMLPTGSAVASAIMDYIDLRNRIKASKN